MSRKRGKSETISSIFKTVGQPTVTYVRRDNGALEKRLASSLEVPGQIVLLTGPSKTGKTTLYKKVLDDLKLAPLTIRCDGQLSATEFWTRCLESINFSRLRELHEQNKVESKLISTIGTKLGWSWLAEATGSLSAEVASGIQETAAREAVLAKPAPMHLVPPLKKLPLVLIIEDFHYLSEETRKAVAQQMKTLVDEEVSAVIVSTTHHAIDVVTANEDLTGRTILIDLPNWEENDLSEIANSGFNYLEVDIKPDVINEISRESVGLPIVTQNICEQIFHEQGVFKHERGVEVETNSEMATRAMERTALHKFSGFKSYYDKLVTGPRKRARKYDTYELVIMCFAVEPIEFELAKHEIMDRLQKMHLPNSRIPPLGSVNSMLNALQKFQNKQKFELLEWQADEEKLYMVEPCFLFFIRWGLEKSRRRQKPTSTWSDLLDRQLGSKDVSANAIRIMQMLRNLHVKFD